MKIGWITELLLVISILGFGSLYLISGDESTACEYWHAGYESANREDCTDSLITKSLYESIYFFWSLTVFLLAVLSWRIDNLKKQ